MMKINNASAKFHGNFKVLSGPIVPSGIGKYWYTTTTANDSNKWQTVSSWYTDANHIYPAASIPDGNVDVIILGSIGPFADIDRGDITQPKSINSGTAGVEFYSANFTSVNCPITGTATFSGNARYINN